MLGTAIYLLIREPRIITRPRVVAPPRITAQPRVIGRPRWRRAAFCLSWAAIIVYCLLVWTAVIKLIF